MAAVGMEVAEEAFMAGAEEASTAVEAGPLAAVGCALAAEADSEAERGSVGGRIRRPRLE